MAKNKNLKKLKNTPRIYNAPNEKDQELIMSFCTKIVAEGFCAASELQEEYGNEAYTKMIASLFRTHRLLREVHRPWKNNKNATGYEWADRRFSQSESKKMPPELQVVIERFKKPRFKYADYHVFEIKCEWTNYVLGAIPNENGEKYNRFDRGPKDSVLIPAYCLRAMAAKGLPMIGKEISIARRIGWSCIIIHKPKIEMTARPVIDTDGFTGLGINRSERLPIGTQFTVRAMVPTSVLTEEDFHRLFTVSGEFVRFSPARSSGFGDFKILSIR